MSLWEHVGSREGWSSSHWGSRFDTWMGRGKTKEKRGKKEERRYVEGRISMVVGDLGQTGSICFAVMNVLF